MGLHTTFKEEYCEQAAKLCALGATDIEIADFFEVNIATLYRWKIQFPSFCEVIKVAKEAADTRVERSLYQKALGYEQDEVKIFMPANSAEPVYAPFRAKIAPDTTAAIFWLKNRQTAKWRDIKAVELTGADGGPLAITEVVRKVIDPHDDA
jgi:hypothetical protein